MTDKRVGILIFPALGRDDYRCLVPLKDAVPMWLHGLGGPEVLAGALYLQRVDVRNVAMLARSADSGAG
jgi:hypothetical protein